MQLVLIPVSAALIASSIWPFKGFYFSALACERMTHSWCCAATSLDMTRRHTYRELITAQYTAWTLDRAREVLPGGWPKSMAARSLHSTSVNAKTRSTWSGHKPRASATSSKRTSAPSTNLCQLTGPINTTWCAAHTSFTSWMSPDMQHVGHPIPWLGCVDERRCFGLAGFVSLLEWGAALSNAFMRLWHRNFQRTYKNNSPMKRYNYREVGVW